MTLRGLSATELTSLARAAVRRFLVRVTLGCLLIGLLGLLSASSASPSSTRTLSGPAGLIVFSSLRTGNDDLYTIRPDGSGLRRVTDLPSHEHSPAWSPDGRRIAFVVTPRPFELLVVNVLHLVNADGTGLTKLTVGATPAWSPDGRTIVYRWRDKPNFGPFNLYLIDADGTGARPLTRFPVAINPGSPDWSPDGRWIAFSGYRGRWRVIYLVSSDGGTVRRIPHPSGTKPWDDRDPAWSPDGGTIAFWSVRGDWETRLLTFDLRTRKLVDLTRTLGFRGENPTWSPDGRRLAFTSAKGLFIGDLRSGKVRKILGPPVSGADWR